VLRSLTIHEYGVYLLLVIKHSSLHSPLLAAGTVLTIVCLFVTDGSTCCILAGNDMWGREGIRSTVCLLVVTSAVVKVNARVSPSDNVSIQSI